MILTKDIYNKLYLSALNELVVEQIPSKESNPRILQYFSAVNIPTDGTVALHDETSWCAAFVSWVLEQCSIPSKRTLWALTYAHFGVKLDAPIKGCLVVLKRGEKNGHVGFYDCEDENSIFVLGGNQSNKVTISAFPKDRLIAYRGLEIPPPSAQIRHGSVMA